MANEERVSDEQAVEPAFSFIESAGLEGRRITLLDVESALAARTGPQLRTRPTATQVLDSIRALIKCERIVDQYEPGKPGSKHYLAIPARERLKGLFE